MKRKKKKFCVHEKEEQTLVFVMINELIGMKTNTLLFLISNLLLYFLYACVWKYVRIIKQKQQQQQHSNR